MRYRPDLTSCWRPICVSMRSCCGVSATCSLNLLTCAASASRWICRFWRAVEMARRMFPFSSRIWAVSGSTTGEFSDALRSRRLRSSTSSLYLLISEVELWSSSPTLEGITCERFLDELSTSCAMVLKSSICVCMSASFSSDSFWLVTALPAFSFSSTMPFCCL